MLVVVVVINRIKDPGVASRRRASSYGIDWEARKAEDNALRYEDMAALAEGEGNLHSAERYLRFALRERRSLGRGGS